MDILEIEGMEFYAYHGCFNHEAAIGNIFLVDFRGELDLGKPARTDELDDTVNVAEIYNLISSQMETRSRLLEHVAGRIADAIEEEFPGTFKSFSVRVSKKNPPAGGPVAFSRVTINR